MKRVPEAEVMDDAEEVQAYASAAAQAHLKKIDGTFVEHVLHLGIRRGTALDVGSGPAQIPIALLKRLPELRFVIVDASAGMLEQARKSAEAEGVLSRLYAVIGDGKQLGFGSSKFDLVCCNSVLHHLAHPLALLAEIGRVMRPTGALLVRDLRRPGWLTFPWHVGWHGRHYSGKMYRLFKASVAAAYTEDELADMIARIPRLQSARVFRFGRTHIGVERPASGSAVRG